MKKTILGTIVLFALAALVAYIGGASRSYAAFGGEDCIALLLIVYALREAYVDIVAYIKRSRRAKASTSGLCIKVYH